MRFFITGGAGFIGSHLSETLIARGNEVVIIDNQSTGSVRNLSSINAKVELITGDILDKTLLEKYIVEADFVVHLAAALGVFNIVNKPLQSLKTNIQGRFLLFKNFIATILLKENLQYLTLCLINTKKACVTQESH